MIICDHCIYNGRCTAYNPTKSTTCADFRVACKGCKFCTSKNINVTKRVRVGRKFEDRVETQKQYSCTKHGWILTEKDFCGRGESGIFKG